MIACVGCGQTDELTMVENHDPVSGRVTGCVYSCPGCLAELLARPGIAAGEYLKVNR